MFSCALRFYNNFHHRGARHAKTRAVLLKYDVAELVSQGVRELVGHLLDTWVPSQVSVAASWRVHLCRPIIDGAQHACKGKGVHRIEDAITTLDELR